MNRTSATGRSAGRSEWDSSPSLSSEDRSTQQDVDGTANAGAQGQAASPLYESPLYETESELSPLLSDYLEFSDHRGHVREEELLSRRCTSSACRRRSFRDGGLVMGERPNITSRIAHALWKFARFVGPGFLIAVAYIDPGNYATDVAAGTQTKYALLVVIMLSNIFAVFIQSLSIKLGSVTGLNLAENCKVHLPRWLPILLYVFAESAIIATDIVEVVGSAVSLNLLFNIPLVAGCVITLLDVLVTLIFYNPQGTMKALRSFEFFVAALVIGVVVCFCIQLSMIEGSVGEILKGFLPSTAVVKSNGLYLSCGIVGATVMPHSTFLGSGIVQSRLRQLDVDRGFVSASVPFGVSGSGEIKYRPSIGAIRECTKYSVIELTLSLFTFALFVNSSILIVAGASLSGSAAVDADLFGIYDLLSSSISPAAGTVFAVALLLSGISAGIVCTIAGQMISEGMLNWTVAPWLRRLITPSISIVPSVAVAAVVGREGLNATLTASQVALSLLLPIVTAPLVYFTCRSRYMSVGVAQLVGEQIQGCDAMSMANGGLVTSMAIIIWLVIAVMNAALLVLIGLGKAS